MKKLLIIALLLIGCSSDDCGVKPGQIWIYKEINPIYSVTKYQKVLEVKEGQVLLAYHYPTEEPFGMEESCDCEKFKINNTLFEGIGDVRR